MSKEQRLTFNLIESSRRKGKTQHGRRADVIFVA